MKLRDKVRMGDQAGVPSSLRAVESKSKRRPGRPVGSTSGNYSNTFWDIEARKASIIQWVREHPGQETSIEELSKIAQYTSKMGAWPPLQQLIREGKIARVSGKGRKLAFQLVSLGKDLGLDKGDKRNGEVLVYKDLSLASTKQPSDKTIKEAEEFLDVVGQKVVSKSQQVVLSSEEVFVENLDRFMWGFLKAYPAQATDGINNPRIGDATLVLRAFSAYMSNKSKESIDERKTKEETSNARQEEASADNPA